AAGRQMDDEQCASVNMSGFASAKPWNARAINDRIGAAGRQMDDEQCASVNMSGFASAKPWNARAINDR
ncbi:hypothetical protein CJ738_36795, partial [Klebsiella pneumoniae]